MIKTVFKEDNNTAHIIHVHKIVDFLYCQCYREYHPYQAATTGKMHGINIKANITDNVWASMSKKEIAKIRIRKQEANKNRQHDDIYGSDTSSDTADSFDHEDYKYGMVHKRRKIQEGANQNPVDHTSFKNYCNSVINLINYQVYVKNNNGDRKYDDTKGNDSITQFINLAK
jgi:ribosomal protein L19E